MAPPAAEEAKAAMAESETVTPEIYGRSGDIAKHLEGIQKQYDTAEKREFYAQVMGDGTLCYAYVVFAFFVVVRLLPCYSLFASGAQGSQVHFAKALLSPRRFRSEDEAATHVSRLSFFVVFDNLWSSSSGTSNIHFG